jgi:hypothetical protein
MTIPARSVLVTPATPVVSSSVASPTVLKTETPHYLVSGDKVRLAGHVGATPALDGDYVVTVIDATTVSLPITVTAGGSGGTLTRTAARLVLTLDEGKLRAGLDWPAGDERDALMLGFIAAAQNQVEQRTGLALLTQVRDVYLNAAGQRPPQTTPVQAIIGVPTATPYDDWPAEPFPFQPWSVRIVVGWSSVEQVPPLLVHAVGLLTAHYATLGRDLASLNSNIATEVPQGFEAAIETFGLVTLM